MFPCVSQNPNPRLSLQSPCPTSSSDTPINSQTACLAERFITEEMSPDEQKLIQRAIQQIPADQRITVVEAAYSFIHPNTNAYNKTLMITAIRELPPSERGPVLASTKEIIPHPTDAVTTTRMIDVVKQTPLHDREQICASTQRLFNHLPNDFAKIGVFEALAAVPSLMREPVVKAVCSSITLETSAREIVQMILQNRLFSHT